MAKHTRWGAALLAVSTFMTGCATGGDPVQAGAAESMPVTVPMWAQAQASAADVFADLELRLARLRHADVTFEVASQGAFVAILEGVLHFGAAGSIGLEARGTFAGKPVDARLRSDGQDVAGQTGAKTFAAAASAGLPDALVIGMTRMGLLHNLARLHAGAPPDRADADVRAWTQVARVRWNDGAAIPGTRALDFDITVGGQAVAEATLWIDSVSGWPARRRQSVRFGQEMMMVREGYVVIPAR
jgi:hypothetical protein